MSGLEMKLGPHWGRGVGEAAQGEAGNRSGRGGPKTTLENPRGGLSLRGKPGGHVAWEQRE